MHLHVPTFFICHNWKKSILPKMDGTCVYFAKRYQYCDDDGGDTDIDNGNDNGDDDDDGDIRKSTF